MVAERPSKARIVGMLVAILVLIVAMLLKRLR
jgi:hypothetical protein